MKNPASEPKIKSAKNACRLYVNAASEDDHMGLVTFTGNDSEYDDDTAAGGGLDAVWSALLVCVKKEMALFFNKLFSLLRETSCQLPRRSLQIRD